MSVPSTSQQHGRDQKKSKSSKRWIALSFLLSAFILAWSFTLPFRQPGKPLVSSTQTKQAGVQIAVAERIEQRRTNAEEFRDAAIALDREFMRSLEKGRERKPVPGIKQAKTHWNRHVDFVKKEMQRLKDAEEGSPESQYQQKLVESLQDAPQ